MKIIKDEETSLSKFLATSGIASRRKVVDIIKSGKVLVNDVVVKEPGFKISLQDVVTVDGKRIGGQKKIYILLNKPKNCITTVSDEKGRATVMDLIKDTIHVRVYPVGRLDRNTTGVLLLTNDGECAQRLAHPKYEIEKVYHARLDKPLTQRDYQAILAGVELEDGVVAADSLYFFEGESKKNVGIVLHSGANRVVRRIFAHLGYYVEKLDRVQYAGLTKQGVRLGGYRMLSEQEINMLKKM